MRGHRQVSATARRRGISRWLLTIWRRQHGGGELGGAGSPAFIPLTIAADPQGTASPAPLPPNPEARVEITLKNGRYVAVPANVCPEARARLLSVVDSR